MRLIHPIEQCGSIVGSIPESTELRARLTGLLSAVYRYSGYAGSVCDSESAEEYSTLFHELDPSTGHPSRVGRKRIMEHNPFGSEDYSKEEFVAEMGAAMLCGVAGIESRTLDNSASYLQVLDQSARSDSRLIVSATSQAQKRPTTFSPERSRNRIRYERRKTETP